MTGTVERLADTLAALAASDDALAAEVRRRVEPEPWLTAAEVAELLDLKPDTVNRYARDGKLTAHPVSRHWMFRRSEIDRDILAGRLAA